MVLALEVFIPCLGKTVSVSPSFSPFVPVPLCFGRKNKTFSVLEVASVRIEYQTDASVGKIYVVLTCSAVKDDVPAERAVEFLSIVSFEQLVEVNVFVHYGVCFVVCVFYHVAKIRHCSDICKDGTLMLVKKCVPYSFEYIGGVFSLMMLTIINKLLKLI